MPTPRPPPAPTLRLAVDSGRSDHDHVTRDGTIQVGGLAADAQWEYSVDAGVSWRSGQGDTVSAAAIADARADGGRIALLARQTTAAGTGDSAALRFTLRAAAGDLDLDPATGLQSTRALIVDRAAFATGVPLTAMPDALVDDGLQELRLRLDGDGLDVAHDQLVLDRAVSLDRTLQVDDVEIAGVPHLSYRFDAASVALAVWTTDGRELTGSDAAALTNAIRLANPQGRPREGERLVHLSLVDQAGHVGGDATVAVTLDSRQPRLDLDPASAATGPSLVTTSLATPQALFPAGVALAHDNPAASFKQVSIARGGSGLGGGDVLSSRDGGVATALDGPSVSFRVGGVEWHAQREAERHVCGLADGTAASAAQVQAMLSSLTLHNPLAAPPQGDRRFTVTVADALDRTATASATLGYDTIGPVIDLNGTLPGQDHAVAVTPGLPHAFPIGRPSRVAVDEDHRIASLTVTFQSAVTGAFDIADPGRAELFGFHRTDRPGQFDRMFRLGRDGDGMGSGAWITGLGATFALELHGGPGHSPVIVITPDKPFTVAQTALLVQRLSYTAGAGAAQGERTLTIEAVDIAGNVTAIVPTARLDVRAPGTPVLLLAAGADTGQSADDDLTAANGSAAAPLALGGFARAGATVTLFRDADGDGLAGAGETLGTTQAGGDGRWSWKLAGNALADGDHRLGAVADGLTSAIHEITVDTRSPDNLPAIGREVTPRPVLAGTTDPGAAVTVGIDTDQQPGNGYELRYAVRADGAGHWRVDTATAVPAAGTAIRFDGGDLLHARVTAVDLAGNVNVRDVEATVAGSTFSLSDGQVNGRGDGDGALTFTVTRDGDLSERGSVRFAVDRDASTAGSTSDGPASAHDFTGASCGLVDFAPGERQQSIRFTVHANGAREQDEQVVLRLDTASGGEILDGLGIGVLAATAWPAEVFAFRADAGLPVV
ncbi:hypothetical protein [Mitsuaria sp. GD03876]|uniref:hypothetical protein n=1 Tax=Mitsuaria sp. GD03876 TaxID=2975399 RepID=UPI00244BFF6B|nr:hypothetical protein [Mitsuaria sp. GD03876]MDH0865251.1 hypothetical protein [Mitsuaria sp. GD03876]